MVDDQLKATFASEVRTPQLADAEAPTIDAHDTTSSRPADGEDTTAPPSAGMQSVEARTAIAGLAEQFGRYRIIRTLGAGGMGTVYLAWDTHLERQVALKTPRFSEDPNGEQMQRFFREARSAGNLRHPNICPIYDFGEINGKHFITMAYIEGHSLSALINPDKPVPEPQILILIRKLALALQAAHEKGIVHRDLKPANIMVDTSDEPIIMDFGLAQQTTGANDIRLTQTGNILGTPAFMSPEQAEGETDKIGPATDQYSLGVILFEMLTGQLPFQGSVLSVMRQIVNKEPPCPTQLRPETDPRIEAVCLKMMAKAPSDRFPSLKAVADELSSILENTTSNTAFNINAGRQPGSISLEKTVGYGARSTAQIALGSQSRRPGNGRRGIRWSMLAFGLMTCGLIAMVVLKSFGAKFIVVSDHNIMAPSVTGAKAQPLPQASAKEDQPKKIPTVKPAAPTPAFTNKLNMEFVLVQKGKSWLGGGGGRTGEWEVVIANDFYLGQYEVTQEEWEKVTGLTPSWFSRTGPGKELVKDIPDADLKRFPVENVTWDDVQSFLERLNNLEKIDGWVYRLPNAVEWEYACRGGPLMDKSDTAYDFYFDKPAHEISAERANIERRLERTCKVGSYLPNRLGLYDMHGNVWEWCHNPDSSVEGTAIREPRGGGWSTLPVSCTAAFRLGPARWEGRVGLRLARCPLE